MKDIIEQKKLNFDIMCGVPYGAIPITTVSILIWIIF